MFVSSVVILSCHGNSFRITVWLFKAISAEINFKNWRVYPYGFASLKVEIK